MPCALRAAVTFDQSEFLYGQKADLKTYTTLRDRAFAGFQRAADLYAEACGAPGTRRAAARAVAPGLHPLVPIGLGGQRPRLSHAARQARCRSDRARGVAIRGLGGKAADRHLQMFGAMIASSMGEVPPQLKPHYLRSAMRVLGDHPAGKPALERLKFYDDLLGEVQLHAEVDGASQVGRGQSFGVRLSIRYTTALGRESGCFVNLLAEGLFQRPRGRSAQSHRADDRRKAGPDLRGRDGPLPRSPRMPSAASAAPAGWKRRWPISSCGPDPTLSVDRIPPVPVDLEFNDGSGTVRLPVATQVVLLTPATTTPPRGPARP